jgi:hypothetical protein
MDDLGSILRGAVDDDIDDCAYGNDATDADDDL